MTETKPQRQRIVAPKPTEIIPGRVIPFTEIPGMRLGDLRSGDGLSGIITSEQLNTAVDRLAALLCGRSFRGLGLKASSSAKMKTLFEYYRQDADGRNGLGDIRGFETVIYSFDIGQRTLVFRAKGELFSSGRPAVKIDRINTITVTPKGNPNLDSVLLNGEELDRVLGMMTRRSQGDALLGDYAKPFAGIYHPASTRPQWE